MHPLPCCRREFFPYSRGLTAHRKNLPYLYMHSCPPSWDMFFNNYFHPPPHPRCAPPGSIPSDMPSRAEPKITTRIIHNSNGEGEGSAPLQQREHDDLSPARRLIPSSTLAFCH